MQIDECSEDKFPPTIITSEYSFPRCFNNRTDVVAFFTTNTQVQDECRREVTLAPINPATDIAAACDLSTLTLSATDECDNTATNTVMFPFNDVPPVVALSVAKDRLEDTGRKSAALVDVGLDIVATDACTPAAKVSVRVYSDELYLKDADSWKARTVQLSRIEATPGAVTGWRFRIAAEAFRKCNIGAYGCGGGVSGAGNGRVYTVVVCATDGCGLRTCKEATVAVTLKGWKLSAATNDGKNYLLAMDDADTFGTA